MMTSRGGSGRSGARAVAGGRDTEGTPQDPGSLAKATIAAHMRRAVAALPKSCATVRVLSKWRRDTSRRLAPLDAVCSLVEAATERGATNVNILFEHTPGVSRRRGDCLFICDDAPGLTLSECGELFSKGSRNTFRFLHSSMSLGVDVMLFTKTADNRCSVVLLAHSATDAFPKHEAMDAAAPVAQMLWQLSDDGRYTLIEPQRERARNHHVLLLGSPFTSLSRLLRQFDRIPKQGTVVCVCGLHRSSIPPSSQPLLLRRGRDIVVSRVAQEHAPLSMLTLAESRMQFHTSLRHRLSLLFLHPRVSLHLHSAHVEPHHPWGALKSPKVISCPLEGNESMVDVVCGVNLRRRWEQGLLLYVHGRMVARVPGVGPQAVGAPWDQDGCGGVVAVVDLEPSQLSVELDPAGRISKKDLRAACRTVAKALPSYWQWFKQQHSITTQHDMDAFWSNRGYPSTSPWAQRDPVVMQQHRHKQCRRCRCWKRVPLTFSHVPGITSGSDTQQDSASSGGREAFTSSSSSNSSSSNAQRAASALRVRGRKNRQSSCLCAALSQECGADDIAGVDVEREVMRELTSHALDRAVAAILSRESRIQTQPAPDLQDVSDSDSDIGGTDAKYNHGRDHRASDDDDDDDDDEAGGVNEGLDMVAKSDTAREREPSEASSTTAIITTAPWMPPEVVAIKNLKRLLLTLVPVEEMETVAGTGVDEFKMGTFQTMLKVKADAVISAYRRSRDRLWRHLSDNLKATEERAIAAEQRVQALLTSVQPLLTALNGGVEPSFDTSDPDRVIAVLASLADGCDQLDPRWMLIRVAGEPKPPSRLSSRRRR